MPVSELDEVEVELDKETTSPELRQESDGHLQWTVALEPRSQAEVSLAFTIYAHRKVIWS
jgi:hypothetical protein